MMQQDPVGPLDLPAPDRPIFVFARHRGGGTLMLRLLNCHPELVVWREHGGCINQLAAADLVNQCFAELLAPRPEAAFARVLASDAASSPNHDPRLRPLTVDSPASAGIGTIGEPWVRRARSMWTMADHRPLQRGTGEHDHK
jgi:hypothetical protein